VEQVRFQKGQRKDDVIQERLPSFQQTEGTVIAGVAQAKKRVPRPLRKPFGQGGSVPWMAYSTALVNVGYGSCVAAAFGPCFLKFAPFFPYPAKLSLNGHEYLPRQLAPGGIAFAALDNGLLAFGQGRGTSLLAARLIFSLQPGAFKTVTCGPYWRGAWASGSQRSLPVG
jgi:hypothetical protein